MAETQFTKDQHAKFLNLLPLTIALAGLPPSESGKYFTEDQIEARTFTVKHAYRHAKSLAKELIEG